MSNNKNVLVMTDSNSGILPEDGEKLGVVVVPMPVIIDGKEYLENVSITRDEFFKLQVGGADIVTSQPSPEMLIELWTNALKEYESVVYMPMSSGLSGSCQTAKMLAEDFGGKIRVVDNRRISVTLKQAVLEAKALAEQGWKAEDIHSLLEAHSSKSSIYIAVEDLKYLKKGGRITPTVAALGSVLNIKPVLQIQGDKLDAFAKVRGTKAAQNKMLEAIDNDIKNRFPDQEIVIKGAYTCDDASAEAWLEKIKAHFPNCRDISLDPLSLSIATHIGPGSTAITVTETLDGVSYPLF